MKILIIANYVSFPWESGNCRFIYLINKLCQNNNVELITSNFYHNTKKFRNISNNKKNNLKYKITLINEPGYNKNVSLKRLYSHKILSINLSRYLKKINYKPDIIYCSIPSLDVAKVAVKFANEKNIRFIIDIQDLWPEAFKMAINVPVLSDILFFPMMKKANYIYSHSDEIVAVSQTYVDRALKVNKKVKNGLSVFLGTDLTYFDDCLDNNKVKYDGKFIRIGYVGTLGTSYDIKCIIDAIRILNDKGINNLEFIVMGDGPLKSSFEEYAKARNVRCNFTGRLEYPKMVGLLYSCDITVNPIIGTSIASIINKVGDYAAVGKPVVNTQNSNEYISLLKTYNAGLTCKSGDSTGVANKIEYLIKNKRIGKQYGKGNRKMAEELFDRNKTYSKIVDLITKENQN